MRKGFWRLWVVVIGACFIAAGNPAQDVHQAIQDLKSPDLLVVRTAVRRLGDLSKAPNIHAAVNPITDILKQSHQSYDYYTRSLAARSLGLIGRDVGKKPGQKILNPVIETLINDRSDFVKVGAADEGGVRSSQFIILDNFG